MNSSRPVDDPEAVALARVYALLIETARQRKMAQKAADGEEIRESTHTVNEAETLPLSDAASVPLPMNG